MNRYEQIKQMDSNDMSLVIAFMVIEALLRCGMTLDENMDYESILHIVAEGDVLPWLMIDLGDSNLIERIDEFAKKKSMDNAKIDNSESE